MTKSGTTDPRASWVTGTTCGACVGSGQQADDACPDCVGFGKVDSAPRCTCCGCLIMGTTPDLCAGCRTSDDDEATVADCPHGQLTGWRCL